MSKSVTSYPFIGGENGERGGLLDAPAIDSALFTTPTETFTRLRAALSSVTLGASALVSGGIGYRIDKLGGTAYRTPMFVNS